MQPGKPYSHFGRLVLEIGKFIHTWRPPYPVERTLLTTGRGPMMACGALLAAGLSEIFVVLAIKRVTVQRKRLLPHAYLIPALGTCFWLLKMAMLEIAMGTACAV